MHYGYLRTSTRAQLLRRQEEGLRAICDQLWVEKAVSAAARKRPVYERLMQHLQPGDTFVVWDLDRAFRSTIDALVTAKQLQQRGIGFQIVTMRIDTTSPQGMYAYTVWAAGCEFERALLIQRTKDGLAAARKQGKRLGRKPKLTPAQIAQIQSCQQGKGRVDTRQLAKRYGVSPQTVRRALLR